MVSHFFVARIPNMALNTGLDWGYSDNSSEAPYFISFDCYNFARTSQGRADIANGAGDPIQSIVLPGCAIGRGSSHRYSEDSTMSENLAQALATVDEAFDGLSSGDSVNDIYRDAEKRAGEIAVRYQQDAFGHVNSTLGRIEMLTTEAAYLGSSKRRYNFFWNLKSNRRGTSDSDRASLIAEVFETLSLPVVGSLADEGAIAQATRMRPPPIWTFNAITTTGAQSPTLNRTWLGNPKPCVLTGVLSNVDNQAFYYSDGSKPFSYNLSLTFVEMENVLNDGTGMVSRSQYFAGLGGG